MKFQKCVIFVRNKYRFFHDSFYNIDTFWQHLISTFDTIIRYLDFLIIIVSGAWSMLQVLELMDFKTAMRGVRGYLVALLVVYARVGAPDLTKKPEDYWKSETITQADWDKIIKDTVAEEFENHIFKVINLKTMC